RNFDEEWRAEWEDSVADLFAMLAVARSPLEIDVLASLLDEDPPSARMAIDRFGQLLRLQGDLIGLQAPLAAFLLSPSLPNGEPNRFHVDAPRAHHRIAKWCLSRATETPPLATGEARYTLLNAPDHVAALRGVLPPDEMRTLVEATFRAMIDTGFRLRLREEISDPVLLGRPYRRLAELLAAEGRSEMLEQLVGALATAVEPALRAAALDALLLYAKARGPDSRPFICRLALSPDPTPRLVALKAISRLDRDEQVEALKEVITQGDSEVRMAASYALYANWNTEPAALTSEVLLELADLVALHRPRTLKPLLEVLSSVTITNYINNCGDSEVAEQTSALWRRIFHERLHLNRLNRPFLERSVVVPIAARHFAQRVLGGATGFDEGKDGLLPLRAEQRQQVRAAVEGLDPAIPFDRIEADVAQLGESDVLIFRILAAQAIAVRAIVDFESLEGALRRLFEAGSVRLRTTLVLALTTELRECPPAWRPARDPLLAALDLLFVPLGLAYCRAGERMSVHERLIASAETDPEVRRSCIAGTAIVGLYSPNLALAALEPAAEADGEFLSTHAVEALGAIRSLHQAAVDRWVGEWGESALRESVLAAGGFDTARRHIEAIGLYTNGVHQAIHYPFMRETVLRQVFTLMCESGSIREWARSYTRTVLQALRAADYTLINWTK
ncbi:MAG TPA: HEAT repeat domain-containing protein, partial [Solirubrobacterales bacterium]